MVNSLSRSTGKPVLKSGSQNNRGDTFLAVEHLRKTFVDRKRKIEAVKDVSFCINEGEMVGLLGPNGAGKTTTIKSILGLIKPDSGRIFVSGIDCQKEPKKAAKKMAAVLEGARNTYWRLTVWENIVFFAGIHGVSLAKGKEYFEYLIEVLKLKEKRDTEVRKLSSGYKQKTAVACALAKMTPLVFLDEPTLGLDVESSYELREALRNLQAKERRTVVVSSHDMRVIQDVCSRVIIMSRGKIVADEKIQNLLSLFKTRNYRVVLGQNGINYDLIRTCVQQAFPHAHVEETRNSLEVTVNLKNGFEIYELIDILRRSGAAIETITQEEVDLEKAFLEIVRRENRVCG